MQNKLDDLKDERNTILKFVKFKFSRGRIIAASLIILASIMLMVIYPYLIIETVATGLFPFYGRTTAIFSLLVASSCFILFLEPMISEKLKMRISWAFLVVFPIYSVYMMEFINGTNLSKVYYSINVLFPRFSANYLCCLMIFALIYALTRNIFVTSVIGFAITHFYAIANYFVTNFRGIPILPWDLQSASTAADVMSNYNYVATSRMGYAIFSAVFLSCLAFIMKPSGRELSLKKKLIERGSVLAVSIVLFVSIVPMNVLSLLDISIYPWNQKSSTQTTGVLAGFFGNIQFMLVDKPHNYSTDTIAELKEEIENTESPELLGNPEEKPTIIAIMNESLTDYVTISEGRISLTEDNMPFIHSLMESENVISGTAYSSVYGGNTCDSEYEFLTGNSMAFLPVGSKPFQQYVDTEQTSIVSTLASYGYDNVAIHPGKLTAWNRNTAYPYFGFSEFVYSSTFNVPRTLERKLTSDLACYNEVIYQYENHTGENPQFIYNVTIQNHGGFTTENYPTTIQVEGMEGKFPEAEQYLSLVKKSDEAFEVLIDYFSSIDEPVVIFMFGDHWPNLEEEFVNLVLGLKDDGATTIEETMLKYQVPYIIWANYPLSNVELGEMSINYLSGILLRAAGLEGTDYNNYVETIREFLPVITEVGAIDYAGNVYENGESTPYDDLLNDYYALQYNNSFDSKNKDYELFTIAAGEALTKTMSGASGRRMNVALIHPARGS